METPVLKEILSDTVPFWIGRLEKYLPPKAEKSTEGLIITPETIKRDAALLINPPQEEGRVSPGASISSGSCSPHDKTKKDASKLLMSPHGVSRLDAKPGNCKSRFSSITSPVVYYDGESQQMLCDLWTVLNTKRGGLRKEMIALKRRHQAQLVLMPEPALAVETDGEKVEDEDDSSADERATEMLRLRMRMEREKIKRMNRMTGSAMVMGPMSYKRTRTGEPSTVSPPPAAAHGIDDESLKKLLEAIDDNFDQACKVTETAAFVWLKGEVCKNHLTFIIHRLKDTAHRIEKSGLAEDGKADEGKEKEADRSMSPPPVPRPRRELAKKKSDATMRDADSPLLEMEAGAAILVDSGASNSSEESQAPSMESINPEAQPKMFDRMKFPARSPVVVS